MRLFATYFSNETPFNFFQPAICKMPYLLRENIAYGNIRPERVNEAF